MNKPIIAIVGAGPGVGLHVAEKFGREGFRAALVSRNAEKLARYAEELGKAGVEAEGVPADAGDPASLEAAFARISERFGSPDVLVYNAAVLQPGTPMELTCDRLIDDFKVNVAGALACARLVAPEMTKRGNGTILFTGGGLALQPMARVASLAIGKAGIRSLAYTLGEELAPRGVFVGTVTICGFVKPGTFFDPSRIAESYWELYERRDRREIVFAEPQ